MTRMVLAFAFAICFAVQPVKADIGPDCNGLSFDGKTEAGALQIPGCPDRLDRSEYGLSYVGHDEPAVIFYSDKPHSASNFQWEIVLPEENPAPATQSFQNFNTFWFGLPLCDPNSKIFEGPVPCAAPASDANDPNTTGAAVLELQFYPPGKDSSIDPFSCSVDRWCAAANTFSFSTNGTEQFNFAFVQTDGVPIVYPGPSHGHPSDAPNDKTLLMGQGDRIRITLKDTPDGLLIVIDDVTTVQQGFMTLSSANGFETVNEHGVAIPFNFRPEFDTASTDHIGPGFARVGVMFSMEIGHNEHFNSDADDGLCSQGPVVPACYGQDRDYDGTSYVHDWPTNGDANSVKIQSVRGGGIGPLSVSANGKGYNGVYDRIQFETTANGANPDCIANPIICDVHIPFGPMAFYPFYALLENDENRSERFTGTLSGAGRGEALNDGEHHGHGIRVNRDFDDARHRNRAADEVCSLVFGDFAVSKETDNFNGDAQYGTPDMHNRLELTSEIQANPCIPDIDKKHAKN